jgi:hypothetical protein
MSLWNILTGDPDRVRVACLYVLPVLVTILVVFGLKAWRLNEAHKRDADLKLEMLSKGMSADEIARVLNTKTDLRLKETVPYIKK